MKIKIMSVRKSSLLNLIMLVIIILSCNTAYAEKELTGSYMGILFSNTSENFDPDTGSAITEKTGHIKFKLGTQLNEWATVEAQGGFTTDSDEKQGLATLGGYLRYDHKLDGISIFGLLGLGVVASYHDDLDNVNESGLSWGLGIEVYGSKDLSLTLEYISLIDISVEDDDPEFGPGDLIFEMIGIGLTYHFSEETSPFVKNQNGFKTIRD